MQSMYSAVAGADVSGPQDARDDYVEFSPAS